MRIIDSDILVDKMNELHRKGYLNNADRSLFMKLIRSVPVTKDVNKSTWMIDPDTHEHLCKNCGFRAKDITLFCPNCGADMRFESVEYLNYNFWDIAKNRADNIKRKEEIEKEEQRKEQERKEKRERQKMLRRKKSKTARAERERKKNKKKQGVFVEEENIADSNK